MNIIEEARTRLSASPLYSQEKTPDPVVHCKLFAIFGGATWYLTECDGDDICFSYVTGLQEDEWGYVSLSELAALRGPGGVPLIECDLYFTPAAFSSLKVKEVL